MKPLFDQLKPGAYGGYVDGVERVTQGEDDDYLTMRFLSHTKDGTVNLEIDVHRNAIPSLIEALKEGCPLMKDAPNLYRDLVIMYPIPYTLTNRKDT